jgi:cytochrome c biogenesis protein
MEALSPSRAAASCARQSWRWLGSIRVAVVLLIAVALAALPGTLFPQLPPEVAADPAARAGWMSLARDRYGALAGFYHALGLFDVFHSTWFLLLLILLTLNTTVCTLNRIQSTWRVLTRPPVHMPDAFFQRAGFALRGSSPKGQCLAVAGRPGKTAETVDASLRRRGYRVFRQDLGLTTCFYADRNWIGRLGTLITHVALVVLVVAAAWGQAAGWREEQLVLAPGQSRPVGHGLPVRLRSDGFEIVRYPGGMPRDYRAHITVLDAGREVLRQTIRVNAPLTYRRVTFYLASYVPVPGRPDAPNVVLMAVHDPGYVPVIASGVTMLVGLVLSFYLPHRRLWVKVAPDGETWLVGKTEWEKEEPAPWLDQEAEVLRGCLKSP